MLFLFWKKVSISARKEHQLHRDFTDTSQVILQNIPEDTDDIVNYDVPQDPEYNVDDLQDIELEEDFTQTDVDVIDTDVQFTPPNYHTIDNEISRPTYFDSTIVDRQAPPSVNTNIMTDPQPSTSNMVTFNVRKPLVPIQNIVYWPKQPVTQSKRKREHLPSVLTSRKWQEIQQNKQNEKIEAEAEKIVKKLKKADEKVEKEAEMMAKKKTAAEKKERIGKEKERRKQAKDNKKKQKLVSNKRTKKPKTEEEIYNENDSLSSD